MELNFVKFMCNVKLSLIKEFCEFSDLIIHRHFINEDGSNPSPSQNDEASDYSLE